MKSILYTIHVKCIYLNLTTATKKMKNMTFRNCYSKLDWKDKRETTTKLWIHSVKSRNEKEKKKQTEHYMTTFKPWTKKKETNKPFD